jgi:heat shock protein HspQ
MQVGDMVRYSEKERQGFSMRFKAARELGNVSNDCFSSWLGIIVDVNPQYYFVKWMNQDYYISEWGVAEVKESLELVS